MSHGDEVVELPVGFDYHVSTPTVKAAGVGDLNENFRRSVPSGSRTHTRGKTNSTKLR